MPSLLNLGFKILAFLVSIHCIETLLQRPQLIVLGVCVNNLHVNHTVRPLLPQVPDGQGPLLIGVHHRPRLFVGYYSPILLCLIGSSHTWVGVSSIQAKSATPSSSFLCWDVKRPHFLQLMVWVNMELTPHPSQWCVRSGGTSFVNFRTTYDYRQ